MNDEYCRIVGSIIGDIANIDVFKRIQTVYIDVNPIVMQGYWASHTGTAVPMSVSEHVRDEISDVST